MAFWKQALLVLVLLAVGAVLWIRFDPNAAPRLQAAGLDNALVAAIAPEKPAQQAGDTKAGGSARGPAGGTVSVVSKKVAVATVNDRLNAIGTGEAVRTVKVTPIVSGTLDEILIKSGQRVAAGDVLARLDNDEQKIAVERAKLNLQDADNKLKRYRELNATSTVSAVDLSTAQLEMETARLALKQAEVDLRRRSITAPFAGVIGIVTVNVGDYVTTTSPIATIDDRSELLVDFRVPERYAGAVKVDMPITATSVAIPGRTFDGYVSAVDNRVEQDSRTLLVRASLPNANDALRAGMSFTVQMKFPGQNFPSVDPLAVQWDSNGSYVWSVREGKATRVPVEIIQRNPDSVLVNADIKEGEQVVTEGVLNLRPGSEVRIAEAAPQSSGDGAADAMTTTGSIVSEAAAKPAAR